jgi:hypothetical protein
MFFLSLKTKMDSLGILPGVFSFHYVLDNINSNYYFLALTESKTSSEFAGVSLSKFSCGRSILQTILKKYG